MVDGRSKGKRRQHGVELNDQTAVAEKFVGASGVGRTERVRAGHHTGSSIIGACTCPTLSTKQRNGEGEKREYTSTHGWVSLCVSLCESRGDRQARTRSILIISILRNLSTHNLRTSSTFWDDSGAACFPRQGDRSRAVLFSLSRCPELGRGNRGRITEAGIDLEATGD